MFLDIKTPRTWPPLLEMTNGPAKPCTRCPRGEDLKGRYLELMTLSIWGAMVVFNVVAVPVLAPTASQTPDEVLHEPTTGACGLWKPSSWGRAAGSQSVLLPEAAEQRFVSQGDIKNAALKTYSSKPNHRNNKQWKPGVGQIHPHYPVSSKTQATS